jgi:hypothetical protein
MTIRNLKSLLFVGVLTAAGVAQADNPPSASKPMKTQKAEKPPKMSNLTTNEVMQLTQQAMTHIAAAQQALKDNKVAAAKSALTKSKQALDRLYDTPPVTALLNEFDEALNALAGKTPALETLDLAPLTASISSYTSYVDPEVLAGVETAKQQAKKGDAKGTEEALRLARDRVAVDMAFVPVEEAYVRVLAAQQALQNGDTKQALSLIRNVPVVVADMQLSRPLVPIRADLQAAAAAADANQPDRSRKLLQNANAQMQQLESVAKSSELSSQLSPIADDLQELAKEQKPKATQIRELAKRTRSVGTNQSKQG